jgi:hypothetical protein
MIGEELQQLWEECKGNGVYAIAFVRITFFPPSN